MGKNWDWSFDQGKQQRLQAEVQAHQSGLNCQAVPLHSRDATMQACFVEGWHSVTPVEIQRAFNPPPANIGDALRQNRALRDLLRITPC